MASKKKPSIIKIIREALIDGGIVNVDKYATKFYGDTSWESRNRIYAILAIQRSRVEKITNKILICTHSDYYLIEPGDDGPALVESEKRKNQTLTKIDGFGRIMEIAITNHPEIAPVVVAKLSELMHALTKPQKKLA